MHRLAKALIAMMSVECFGASVGYAATGNWKLAAYWLFACGINSIAYTF